MKNLTYTITIAAPRQLVWDTMLSDAGYRKWTRPFCEGSYFEGSWDEGATMKFLAPGGDGMVAMIAENRPLEWVSIRHLGVIKDGVEDTTSEDVKAWAPLHENFGFADADGGTEVTVEMETTADAEKFMNEMYPISLQVLKELCEA